jgi:signal peptidase
MIITFLLAYLFMVNQPGLYLVSSGSMQPALSVGTLLITTKKNRYYPGEVVTYNTVSPQSEFLNQANNLNITHRIIQANYRQNSCRYLTKGDANQVSDNDWINQDQIRGKVSLALPLLGYLFVFLRSKIFLSLLFLFLMVIVELKLIYQLFFSANVN